MVKMKITETAQTGRNETKKLGFIGDNDHQAKRFYHEEGKIPSLNVICNSMVKVGHISTSDSQANRVYSPEGKSCTLSANGGGGGAKTGLYAISDNPSRKMVKVGHIGDIKERNIGNPNNEQGAQAHRVYAPDGICPTLGSGPPNVRVEDYTIRKLTPIECERLQSLPDNYTEGIATTNRYKCLGNAFNADVIAQILFFLK